MSLFVLMLLQTAVPAPAGPPAPTYQISNLPGGAFLITVARLQADQLATIEEDLDRAAANRCDIGDLSAIGQTYDQETDNGNPAPVITNLQLTYKCPPPPEPPKHP